MPILKTRTPFKQIAAEGTMYDAKGAEMLVASAANTAENYLQIANANSGMGPSIEAKGKNNADVSMTLKFKGDGAVSISDAAGSLPGKLELVNSSRNGGLSFTFEESGHTAYTLKYPATVPSGAAFVKVNSSGEISYSTASASSFGISADTGTDETVNSGDTITFAGTAEQIDTAVGSTDTITLSLPNTVSITTALKVPAIQDANGSAALTISTGGSLTAAKNLTVTGNLTVNGTTTTVESSTLTVNDATITIADGATTTAANNAGIYVAGLPGGTNAYAFLKWDNENKWIASSNVESNGTSFNINDTSGQYNVNGRKLVDYTGVYFYGDDAVGSGLKVDSATNKVRLDIKNESTDIFAATETSAESVSVVRIAPASSLNLDHVQVFLNGILQRNTDPVTNSSAYANLSAGNFDCVVRNGTGGIDFLQGVVESADLVTLYYSI